MIAKNADQLLHIGQMRHVFERQRVIRQQRRNHQRERCVLGARDRDDAIEFVAADYSDAIHEKSLSRLLCRFCLQGRPSRPSRTPVQGTACRPALMLLISGPAFRRACDPLAQPSLGGFLPAAASPSGRSSAPPVRRALVCSLRRCRLARSSPARRVLRSGCFAFSFEPSLEAMSSVPTCRKTGAYRQKHGSLWPCRGARSSRADTVNTRLALARCIWQKSAASAGCGSSVVEHSLGKGEVESSILSRSTILSP